MGADAIKERMRAAAAEADRRTEAADSERADRLGGAVRSSPRSDEMTPAEAIAALGDED